MASWGEFGNFEGGLLASATSPVISAVSGGAVAAAGAVVLGLTLPAFRRYHTAAAAAEAPAGIKDGSAA